MSGTPCNHPDKELGNLFSNILQNPLQNHTNCDTMDKIKPENSQNVKNAVEGAISATVTGTKNNALAGMPHRTMLHGFFFVEQ